MADPTSRNPAGSSMAKIAPIPGTRDDGRSTARRMQPGGAATFLNAFPCVWYECDSSFKIKRVSPNCWALLQLDPELLIGTRAFRDSKVFPGDGEFLAEKLRALEALGSISCVHRLINDAGLPIWVTHCLKRVQLEKEQRVRGWIFAAEVNRQVTEIDHHVVSRFIHKLGNHLQLLTLLGHTLRNQLRESKDLEVLQQTVEQSIELTRALANYNQAPEWASEVGIDEVLDSVIGSHQSAFADMEIVLDITIEDSVRGAKLRGDSDLLDSAISGVLRNALEATDRGGRVSLTATARQLGGKHPGVVQIRVTDCGCGIPPADLSKIADPFFTTKKNHDGLGLSMATRFIELHGGVLTVDSQPNGGVQVTIILPEG